MNNENHDIGPTASALVLLAAIATTFSTYGYYKDEKLAEQYEQDGIALEQTASALSALRIMEQSQVLGTTTEDVVVEDPSYDN